MKNSLIFIFSVLLNTIIFSQGGNTAATASGAPITIPFSAAGSTAPNSVTDDYSFPNGFNSIYTFGPDYLYYFCATSTNNLTVSLTFTPSSSSPLFPSLSIWTGGAPGVGSVVDTVYSYGSDNSAMALSFTPVIGQCYYIMVDSYSGYVDGFPYNISVEQTPQPTLQPACTNLGYENANFSGWSGSYGNTVTSGKIGDPLPEYTPNIFNTSSSQHMITSAGNDPLAGFPMVCPGFGPNSTRLGDGAVGGYGCATLQEKFSVTTSNALLTYNYAVVITDATNPVPILAADGTDSLDVFGDPVYYQNYTNTGDSLQRHPSYQQPFFKVDLLDCNGNPITCGQYLVVGGEGIPGFTQIGTSNIYYKNWTSVFIDLTPYIGSCVTIKYTVADCSLGAHYCYAYVDASCAPMAITGPTNVCPGVSSSLTAPAGAASYSWVVQGSTTVLGTSQILSIAPTVNTTYVCNMTSVTNCNTMLTYPVAVYPIPVATATNTTVCAGNPGTITTTVNPTGGSFTWTNGGSSNTFTLTPASTTTYTGTYTDLNGCIDTAVAVITVNPLPVAPPTSPVTYCQNQTPNSLTSSVTVTSGCTLNWYTAPTGGTASSTAPTISTATASTTTYYVSQTVTATGCEGPRSAITVTVNPLPVVTVNSPSTCAGIAVTLTASGANTYSWSTTPTQTGASISVTPLVPTSYTVTGTSTLNCSNSATSNVSINGSLSLSVNSEIICEGSSTVLTAVGATDYLWDTGETTASITVSPTIDATYSVTGTTAGCTGTVTSTVTVDPMPTVTVNSATVCNGTAASLTATPSIPGGSYSWSPISPATQTITVTPANTTPYTVTYTLNSCQTTGTGTVTVNPVPTVSVNSQTICIGDPVTTLTATPSIGGGSYLWNPSSLTTSSISFSPVSTTSYTVTYTLNNCPATGTGTISVNPLPVVSAGLDQTVCINESVVLTASGASTYSWDNGVSNGIAFTPAGTNVYTVTGTSDVGCIATDDVTVTVEQLPVVSFAISDTFGCAPLNVVFTNTTTGVDNCVWTLSDGTTLNGCSSVTNLFTQAGCFDVTLTTTSPNGCVNSLTDYSAVCVEANPIADFVASPTSMPNYNTLSNMTNNSVGAISYNWNFGDGTTSTDVNPSHIFPMTEGDYLITLIAHSEHCYDTAFMSVSVFEETIFYVPNTFTPDGDDFNEMFKPIFSSGFDPDDFTLYIFDRWGELIFESHNADIGWRGTYGADNIIVQDGTYTWKIIYKHKTDKKKNVVVGHVNVLK